jgi:hypothetical protein
MKSPDVDTTMSTRRKMNINKPKNTKQKNKKMSNVDPTTNHGVREGQVVPVFIGNIRCDSCLSYEKVL